MKIIRLLVYEGSADDLKYHFNYVRPEGLHTLPDGRIALSATTVRDVTDELISAIQFALSSPSKG